MISKLRERGEKVGGASFFLLFFLLCLFVCLFVSTLLESTFSFSCSLPENDKNTSWRLLLLTHKRGQPIVEAHTDGIKITFTRAIPKSKVYGTFSVQEDDEPDHLEEDIDLDPAIDFNIASAGWYNHAKVDFSTTANFSVLGVDPGQNNPFTFYEEDCTREHHLQADEILKKKYKERYVLQPFEGLPRPNRDL